MIDWLDGTVSIIESEQMEEGSHQEIKLGDKKHKGLVIACGKCMHVHVAVDSTETRASVLTGHVDVNWLVPLLVACYKVRSSGIDKPS